MKAIIKLSMISTFVLLNVLIISAQQSNISHSLLLENNPDLPTELTFMPNIPLPENASSEGASSDGRHLFIPLSTRDVYIYDMQNIGSPLLISKIEELVLPGSYLSRTYYNNGLLFISDWDKNLHIYDCSDPANPVKKSTTVMDGAISSMAFEENIAYLLIPYVDGLIGKSRFIIMDVSDPQNLQEKSRIDINGRGGNGINLHLSKSRKLVYLRGMFNSSSGAITTLNVSNIQSPSIVNILNVTMKNDDQLLGYDDYFFISQTNSGKTTLIVYSSVDASNPTIIKTFELPGTKEMMAMTDIDGTLLIYSWPFNSKSVSTFVYDKDNNEFLTGLEIQDTEGWGTYDFVIFKEPIGKTSKLNKLGNVNRITDNSNIFYAVFGYGSPPQRVIKLSKTPTVQKVNLTVTINPPEAASDGCSTTPGAGVHEYNLNETISLNAVANGKWAWDSWSGDVTGPSRQQTLLMDANKFVNANFTIIPDPVLTVSGSKEKVVMCPKEIAPGSYIFAGTATFTADEAADWSLGGFNIQASGNGNDELDVESVKIEGAATIISKYSIDNGVINVVFTPPVIIAKSSSEIFTVSYKFGFDPEIYGYDSVTVFNWNTKGISATPLENPPGIIQGQASMDSLTIARVTTSRGLAFAKIQEAIDSDNSQNGDVITVCDGAYEEKLFVNKQLHIKSVNGSENTGILPFLTLPQSDEEIGVLLGESNTTIEGFSIYGNDNPEGKSLIAIGATGENTLITNNIITSFSRGILAELADDEPLRKFGKNVFPLNRKMENGEIRISENLFEDVYKSNAIEINNYPSIKIDGNFFSTNKEDSFLEINSPALLTIEENQSLHPMWISVFDTTKKETSGNDLIIIRKNQIINDTTGAIIYMGKEAAIPLYINSNDNFDMEISGCKLTEISENSIPTYLGLYSPQAEIDIYNNKVHGKILIEEVNPAENKTALIRVEKNIFDSDTSTGLLMKNILANADTLTMHSIRSNKFGGNYFSKIICENVFNTKVDSNFIEGSIDIFNGGNNIIEFNEISGNPESGTGIDISANSEVKSKNNKILNNTINGFSRAGILIDNKAVINTLIKSNFIGTDKEGNNAIPNLYGLLFYNCAEITIEENLISGNRTGIMMKDSCENILIKDNTFGINAELDTKLNGEHGISFENNNKNITIEGNIFSGLMIGIKARHVQYDPKTVLQDIVIKNNRFGIALKLLNVVGVSIWNSAKKIIFENNKMPYNGDAIVLEGNGVTQNVLRNNIIGLNEEGNDLAYTPIGILIKHGPSENIICDNIITGLASSISIAGDNTIKNIARNNLIGIDAEAKKSFKNVIGISVTAGARNNTIEKNILGGSEGAIAIINPGTSENKVSDNIIGTDEKLSIKFSIKNGISLLDGATNNVVRNNTIGNSDSATAIYIQGFNTSRNLISSNFIGTDYSGLKKLPNQIGVCLIACNNNTVTLNKVYYNTTGIYSSDSHNSIFQNDISYCSGNTGIHLKNSGTNIIGNIITNDATDAIKCTDRSNPKISANNIYNNSGFGLLNTDPNITVTAGGNWWGNSSGPSGSGSGSGDKIGGNVIVSNWLEYESKLIVNASRDTLYIPENGSDSLSIFYSNWDDPFDILNISLSSDKESWIAGEKSFVADLQTDSLKYKNIIFRPSQATANKDAAKVFVSCSSQSNPMLAVQDTFYVSVYKSTLNYIRINPDSTKCLPGESIKFTVFGYDKFDHSVFADVFWEANGGTIDSSGLFKAGSEEGVFRVTAKDKYSNIISYAYVQIGEVTVSVEETADNNLHKEFILFQNYPNPFNPTSKIKYQIADAGFINLTVYDILGREVKVLVNEHQKPGYYEVTFKAHSNLASGVYLYRLTTNKFTAVKKLMLIK